MASAGVGGFWAEFISRSWIATSMRNLAAVAILLSLHTVDCRGQTTIVGASTPVKRALGEINLRLTPLRWSNLSGFSDLLASLHTRRQANRLPKARLTRNAGTD